MASATFNEGTDTVPKDSTPRRRRRLPGITASADQLDSILSNPATGRDVRAALWRGLTEAMETREVSILTPAVARAIFLAIFDPNADRGSAEAAEDRNNTRAGCVTCHHRWATLRLLELIGYAANDNLASFKGQTALGCERCREALRRTADGDDAPAHVLTPAHAPKAKPAGRTRRAAVPSNPWGELGGGWQKFLGELEGGNDA